MNFHYQNGTDIIQPGDIVIILLVALGIFVLVQIMNGVVNIATARHMKRQAKLQSELREDENRIMDEHWEDVIIKYSEIMEKLLENEGKVDFMLESLQDIEEVAKPKKIRGKYKPRKPKLLENKKSPSDTQGG